MFIWYLSRLIAEGKGKDATELIEKISIERRNLKQKPLLFALAMCARSDDRVTKRAAYSSFLGVCRIPTCLFLFIKYCEELSAPGKLVHTCILDFCTDQVLP